MLNYNRLNPYVLIVTTLLLAVGCDCGCKRKQLEYEQDKTLFEITTTKASQIGGIGTNLPILDCEGEIAINNIIDDKLYLCALVIPTGVNVKEAIEEVNSIAINFSNEDQGKPIDLVNANGVACYIKELTSGVKGTVNAQLIFSTPLSTGKHIVYLFVPTESHGTYYSLQGQEFEIRPANVTTDPSIILKTDATNLKAEHIPGSSNVKITAVTEVINYDGDYTGGFLFIEESSTQTVRDILNKQIEKKTTFSHNPDFQLLDGNPEVIICSFEKPTIDEKENRLWEKQDNAPLFKRNKKYKTYGYLYNSVTNVYTISQEGQLAVPPLPRAALTVTGDFRLYFSTRYLPQDSSSYASDNVLNSTELRGCSLSIDKNEFIAKDSKIGFVFVKDGIDVKPEALKGYINGVNDAQLKKEEFYSTKDVVVYTLSEEINNGMTGTFTAPGDILVQVGKPMFEVAKYHVYAWLQNSEAINGKKDVFVSTAAKEFTIDLAGFQEFAVVDAFKTRAVGSTGLMIKEPDPDHNDGTALTKGGAFVSNYRGGNTKVIGYIVCRGKTTKPTLEGLLKIVGPDIDGESGYIVNCLIDADRRIHPGRFPVGDCLYLPYDCHYSDFSSFYHEKWLDEILTSVWLVVANGRSVAVTRTDVSFTYLRPLEKGEPPVIVKGRDYVYDLTPGKHLIMRTKNDLSTSGEVLRWQDPKPANGTTRDELIELANQYDHNQSIYECLNNHFNFAKEDEDDQLKAIITFIQAMN